MKATEKFKELIEKRSNGQLKVEIYPSSQLGGEREMQEMVALGTLEMSVSGITVIYEPLYALLEAPFLYRDRDHIKKVMASPIVAELGETLLEEGDPIRRVLRERIPEHHQRQAGHQRAGRREGT